MDAAAGAMSPLLSKLGGGAMDAAAGAIGPLLSKLGELLADEFKLEKRVKKGVRSLRTELELMHATLIKVGEVPRDQLDMEVRIWAGKVRDLSYDMEDAIDRFMVRVEERGHDAKPTKLMNIVKNFFMKAVGLFRTAKELHQISDVIQEIQEQAKELAEQRNRYKIEQHSTSDGVNSVNIDPSLIAMYKDVTELVGIEEPRDKLIQKLIEGDEGSKLQLKTISIVGFGGLGKTTLAKAVYDRIKVQFHCGAFVSVSRTPDMKKVLKDMMYELDKGKFGDIHSTTRDEKLLIDELREFLENKRYLIIIDDIWDEKAWRVIQCALSKNSLGSRLIITTRNTSVAEACHSSNDHMIHAMKPLSNKDSQRLFNRRIFHNEMGCPDQLQEVSRAILKKCGGVPLAIIAIASLLASNQGIKPKNQWCHVLKSIGRGLAGGAIVEHMQKILSFSYYDLPSHLKACLLYLSIFPEDYYIERERLIWRWIAEGFIHHEKQETSLFVIGESYFNELVNRSMIIPVDIDREDNARACRVHDMVLDLIFSLSSEENFVTVFVGNGQSKHDSQSKVRRLSIQDFDMAERSTLVDMSMSQVRSVSLFVSPTNLMPSLVRFEVLRVLDLKACYLGEEDVIGLRYLGNLLHLRYLSLGHRTFIRHLPSEIGKLQFLQTLDLDDTRFEQLPSSVEELRQLTRLCVNLRTKVPPIGLANLVALEELRTLDVDHFSQHDFEELSNLTELRVLKIYFSSGGLNESKGKALAESIGNMHRLQSLVFVGMDGYFNFIPEGWVPPPQLRRFRAGLKKFPMLPKWINPSSLPLLSYVDICVDEARWEDIQILGTLPALRNLCLTCGSMEERAVDRGFEVTTDAFPCLRECRFFGPMSLLPSMFPPGAMPMLRDLRLPLDERDMPIGGLDHLPSLERVEVDLWFDEASDEEVEAAEAAVRQAADAHPNRPTLVINWSKKEVGDNQSDGSSEVASQGSLDDDEEARSSRTKDLLTVALGNRKHPGRTRGVGVAVPWREGFLETEEKYERRNAAKRSRTQSSTATMDEEALERRIQEEVRRQVAAFKEEFKAQLALSRKDLASPGNIRSSYASAEGETYPCDTISESTPCTLLARIARDVSLDAAFGIAYPNKVGTLLHGRPIAPNYQKVHVDDVVEGFKQLPLAMPPNDEITVLHQTVGTFIQWPKRDIKLLVQLASHGASHPPSPLIPEKNPSPMELVEAMQKADEVALAEVKTGQPAAAPSAGPKELLVMRPVVSSVKEFYVKGTTTKSGKSKGRSSTSRTSKASEKSKAIALVEELGFDPSKVDDLPFVPMARRFVNGQPFVEPEEIANSLACQRLQDWYMQTTNNLPPGQDMPQCVAVGFKEEHLFHQEMGGLFYLYFEDMFELFTLDALEQNMLRCWTLFLFTEARLRKEPIGFIDPGRVTWRHISDNRQQVLEYVTHAMLAQKDKDYILFPYNPGFHWVLVVVMPRWNKVIYFDSSKNPTRDFTPIKGILDEAFVEYKARGGRTGKGAMLKYKSDFMCHQQPQGTNLCGFYVCYHMERITENIWEKKDFLAWKFQNAKIGDDELKRIRGVFAYFINNQIINPDGEFYGGGV